MGERRISIGSDADMAKWKPWRQFMAFALSSIWCEMVIGIAIFGNAIIVIVDTNYKASCHEVACAAVSTPTSMFGHALLGLYCMELIARLATFRLFFFDSTRNCFDFCVIGVSIAGEIVLSFKANEVFFRLLRLLRLARFYRLLAGFHELYVLLHGLLTALKVIGWAAILMYIFLTI